MTLSEAARPTVGEVGAFRPPAPQDRGAALALLGMEIDETRREIAARLASLGAQPHRFRSPD